MKECKNLLLWALVGAFFLGHPLAFAFIAAFGLVLLVMLAVVKS